MPFSSGQRKGVALTVLEVVPTRPRVTTSMQAKALTPSLSNSAGNYSVPAATMAHNIAGPIRLPCFPPLDETIVRSSPGSIPEKTSTGLSQ